MDNSQQNFNNGTNMEKPVDPATSPALTPGAPSVVMDTGNGLSASADSLFGHEVKEINIDSDTSHNIADYNTLPLTEAGSAYVTPAKSQSADNDVPDVNSSATVNDSYIMGQFSRRQAKPIRVVRGTNIIAPLGCEYFAYKLGDNVITTVGSDEVDAAISAVLALQPNIKTPGSFKEVASAKRIEELKNVIISYFNRSIPFTDLKVGDRFAIEACYTSDIGICMLPILAKYKAMCYVKRMQDLGYQYEPALLTNLQSQSAEVELKNIYSAIGNLSSVDDTFFEQMAKHSKLYATASKEGFAGTVFEQDLEVGRLANYRLERVNAGSGYTITTTGVKLSASTVSHMSLIGWVEMWLRSDLHSVGDLVKELHEVASYAQAIRSNYQLLLAAIQQLAQKGACKYTAIRAFLPVTDVGEFTLVYKEPETVFSYAMKERFEYAPRYVSGENSAGASATFRFNLLTPMSSSDNYIDEDIKFLRPVGLYKGDKCWNTKEINNIGVFKHYAGSTGMLGGILGLAKAQGFTVSSGLLVNVESTTFVDAYYGSLYNPILPKITYTTDDKGVVTMSLQFVKGELVSYYGINNAQAAPYCSMSGAFADGSNTPNLYRINSKGTQILQFTDFDTADESSHVDLTMNQLSALFTQLDLTLYIGETKNVAGKNCYPLVLFTGYRGAFFDDFDVSIINNAMAANYLQLAIALTPRAMNA